MAGGIIPEKDIAPLKALGIREIFLPGTPTQTLVDYIRQGGLGEARADVGSPSDAAMEPLPTRVDAGSAEFAERSRSMEALVADLREELAKARAGRRRAGSATREQKKMFVRERIDALLDPGSPFLELSPLAAHGMYDGEAPGAGIVTGIGRVSGREVMVVANDATVKGGTYFPMTVKKHLRAQEIARGEPPARASTSSTRAAPSCRSRRTSSRTASTSAGSSTTRRACRRSAFPQIAVVMGSCTAGGAYVPAMSDETIIVKGTGTIFLAGPPLVKAATGEEVTAEELGGADVHTRVSGVADHFAEDDAHALEIARVDRRDARRRQDASGRPRRRRRSRPTTPKEIYGVLPRDLRKPYDVREVIARLVDGSRFHEFKARYGTTLVCGFARLSGFLVGIVANNGILFSESALKATHFIEMCARRKVPLLFLQNITGFMVGREYERGGIAKDGAKMVHAVANAAVPKLTVIIGGSFGAGNYGMCGRAYDPRFLFIWPNARISVMGGPQAASVLSTVKQEQLARAGKPPMTAEETAEFERPTREKYEAEGHPYYATARLWDDGILDPGRDARRPGARPLGRVTTRRFRETQFGVFRM